MRILYVTYIPFSTGKDKEDFSQFLHYYTAYYYILQHKRDREIEIEQWHPGELVQFSLSVNCIALPGLKKKI